MDGDFRFCQSEEPPEQVIHRPIPKQDRVTVALDLILRRLQQKRAGVHVAPICMLQMSGAVDEEGRKIRAHSTIVVPEQIELQAVRERYAPPLNV